MEKERDCVLFMHFLSGMVMFVVRTTLDKRCRSRPGLSRAHLVECLH